jgi:hypothetical protein
MEKLCSLPPTFPVSKDMVLHMWQDALEVMQVNQKVVSDVLEMTASTSQEDVLEKFQALAAKSKLPINIPPVNARAINVLQRIEVIQDYINRQG